MWAKLHSSQSEFDSRSSETKSDDSFDVLVASDTDASVLVTLLVRSSMKVSFDYFYLGVGIFFETFSMPSIAKWSFFFDEG